MKALRVILSLSTIVVIVFLWQLYVTMGHVPSYVVPGPFIVARQVRYLWSFGDLWHDCYVTLVEVFVGMMYGIAIGVVSGVLLAKSRMIERLFTPIILIIQTTPKISMAPLIVLWFGLGLQSKVILIAIVTFYPIMINLITAIRGIDPTMLGLFGLLHCSPLQRIIHLEIPVSIPGLLAGIRVGSTLAVTAAVIGELVGSTAGLGYLLSEGQNNADVSMVLVSILFLSLIGYLLYMMIRIAEMRYVTWLDHSSIL